MILKVTTTTSNPAKKVLQFYKSLLLEIYQMVNTSINNFREGEHASKINKPLYKINEYALSSIRDLIFKDK